MIDKSYSPTQVESRWYAYWMEKGYFHADEHSEKPPFCIVIPPPNVTGKLHMGHALFVTIQDLLTRYKRMQGFEALWLPGTDHAGIATQVMVERQLAAEGKTRLELGREAFLERVWAWKREKGSNITEQLKLLGASCDWARERFTLDEGLCHAVVEAFVRLYEEGLIYRDERLVNWDPVAKTVLSDLEIDQEPESGHLWHIRYDLEDGTGSVVIATTRPETMFGDVAVCVHPGDERYQAMIGKMLRLPLTDRTIPVIADAETADPAFGSGAVKITPAHDFNDFACGQRHHLPRIQVIGMDARMLTTSDVPARYRGMTREACREAAVGDLQTSGHLVKIEGHTYMPSRSQRSGALVEPLLLPQWWVNARVLAEPAIKAVETGKTRMTPVLWEKTFFNWMHNIRDWCISRQLWWGHQIPAWYCEDCSRGHIHRIEQPGHRDAELRIDSQARPIVSRTCPETCPVCGGVHLVQEPDVLDTWFSSGLWPFSTMGWPEETDTLKKFYPTSVMETAADIIFFWVARMMMFGSHFMGETPFRDIYFHALVRDKVGQKMSKTKGNVIDPLLLVFGCKPENIPDEERKASRQLFDDYPDGIDPQGADALRFSLTMLAAQGRDVRLDIRRIEGYRAFLNKVWQASRFVLMNLEGTTTQSTITKDGCIEPFEPENLSLADAWILDGLNRCIEEVTQAIDKFNFNEAAQSVYEFLWNAFCDWYIELSKSVLYAKDEAQAANQACTRWVLVHVLETILRLLHPFAPFMTEEIWQALPKGEGAPDSIMIAPWPKVNPKFCDVPRAALTRGLIAVVSAVRNIRGEANIPPGKLIPRLLVLTDDPARQTLIETMQDAIRQLGRVEMIEVLGTETAKPAPCAVGVADGVEIVIPFAGLIDMEEERGRLDKNIAKLTKDVEASRKKLDNPSFVERAKPEVVETERERLERHMAELEKLQKARVSLG
ncbi:MAG: valine--tRNA ligase [Proteobacteria bacterium]|nr:valine--tRNA ligase [Pseudomonadota bacterium]